jgi:virulence-associated protein VapD
MFAIAFDMSISKLKENFGEPYNNDIRAFRVEDWSDFTGMFTKE